MAAYRYEDPVARVITRAKYRDARSALTAVAKLAIGRVATIEADLVVPIPLGQRRRIQRGYNQAELIARIWAASWQAPIGLDLVRIRETAPQVGNDLPARSANVAGAFRWRGGSLSGLRICLVDDVHTTGATLAAAQSALRHAGAAAVGVAVLATVV